LRRKLPNGVFADDRYPYPSSPKALAIDKSAASRRAKDAESKGYLVNLEDQKGKLAGLVVGDPLPEDAELVPAPRESVVLQCCRQKKGYTRVLRIETECYRLPWRMFMDVPLRQRSTVQRFNATHNTWSGILTVCWDKLSHVLSPGSSQGILRNQSLLVCSPQLGTASRSRLGSTGTPHTKKRAGLGPIYSRGPRWTPQASERQCQNRPVVTTIIQDIDSAGEHYAPSSRATLRRRKQTASHCVAAAGMVTASSLKRRPHSSRDSLQLPATCDRLWSNGYRQNRPFAATGHFPIPFTVYLSPC
jgi:hypothetical protein